MGTLHYFYHEASEKLNSVIGGGHWIAIAAALRMTAIFIGFSRRCEQLEILSADLRVLFLACRYLCHCIFRSAVMRVYIAANGSGYLYLAPVRN